ncbi:hypothetical protein SipoB123_18960 [Streptomyces ipomoeae]|nr:hypothetical protein SipoB123_18960 [Streptomyces ipomoeae]
MHLDRLIAATAATEYVPLHLPAQPGRRPRASHTWVTAQDREKYLDATQDTLADHPEPGTFDDVPAEPEGFPLSRECSYQQRLEEQERRAGTPRDTTALLSAGITIRDPKNLIPHPRSTTLPGPPADTSPVPPRAVTPQPAAPRTGSPAPVPPPDRHAAAARLGRALEQVGPCAACQDLTRRYGRSGNPLCAACCPDTGRPGRPSP